MKRKRKWQYAGDSRNWPAGSWVDDEIDKFWDRYDEDGVKRTITIDECDRKRVSKELADYLKSFDKFEAEGRKA